MAAITHLTTVEEFLKLPDDRGPVYYELRHGEIVPVTRPKFKHSLIQRNLRRLLEALAEPGSYIDVETAFRPQPEYELWVADLAYLRRERFRGTDPDDNVRGAPDLVVEVLSPSNTTAEMYEREKVCLENGAREFWVVDPERRQVKVSAVGGRTETWREGQEIPIALFGRDDRLRVDDIFDY